MPWNCCDINRDCTCDIFCSGHERGYKAELGCSYHPGDMKNGAPPLGALALHLTNEHAATRPHHHGHQQHAAKAATKDVTKGAKKDAPDFEGKVEKLLADPADVESEPVAMKEIEWLVGETEEEANKGIALLESELQEDTI
jgi:hypothetical protein